VETFVPVGGEILENIRAKEGGINKFFAPRFIKQIGKVISCSSSRLCICHRQNFAWRVEEVVK
jgi:hypothetical protein